MTSVAVVIAAHQDEPALAATIDSLARDLIATGGGRVVVCVNGRAPAGSVAWKQMQDAAARAEVPVAGVLENRASKPAAWNVLRGVEADVLVFADADIEVRAGSITALLRALDDPAVVIAAAGQSPRDDEPLTRAAVRGRGAAPAALGWRGRHALRGRSPC